MFKRHHYLSSSLPSNSKCFVGVVGKEPVAFVSIGRMPHPIAKDIMRITRVVVRPDYQGLGIGFRVLNEVGKYYRASGQRVSIVTSTPSLVRCFENSDLWRLTRQGRSQPHGGIKESSAGRYTTCWEMT